MFAFLMPGLFETVWLLSLLCLGIVVVALVANRVAAPPRPHNRPSAAAPSHGDRSARLRQQRARYQEEQVRILAMVEAGTITAEEATRLLDTLEREITAMSCPFCGGEIRVEAVKCRHCNEVLVEEMRRTRSLTRSHDRVLAGVCGGVAEHLGLDPTIVRVLTALVVLFSGIVAGLVIYLIAALIIPPPPADYV